MKETIFVTGAGGNVGSQVAKNLVKLGVKVRGAKLHHEKLESDLGIEYELFDFAEPQTWEACLKGVNKVFLMRPPHISNIKRDMLPFMKYLKEINIQQVVFLSVQGAEGNKIVPHYKVEQFCIQLGLPYTFIRPSFFMQNLTTTHLEEIRDEKIVFVPTGKGKTNFIDVRDIGEIAAKLFFDKKYINQGLTITGQKSFSYAEIAEELSKGLDQEIKFVNPGILRFIGYHQKKGRKLGMTLVMVALYSIVKLGKGNISTSTAEEILGRKPITLQQFIADHKQILQGSK